MLAEGPRIEVIFETRERVAVNLTGDFLKRIRFIVEDREAGYSDVADLVRAALRAEVERAERGLYGRRRKW
jgi:Arc/MetJ-type ribon-helix-helix transcriptional regulator